jgi:hypothetical protein
MEVRNWDKFAFVLGTREGAYMTCRYPADQLKILAALPEEEERVV